MERSNKRVLFATVIFLFSAAVAGATPDSLPSENGAGDVLIQSRGHRQIVAWVDSYDASGSGDGLVDRWFVMQNEDFRQPISVKLTHATIEHSATGWLYITSEADNFAFEFALRGQARDISVPGHFSVTKVTGFGVAPHFYASKHPLARLRLTPAAAFAPPQSARSGTKKLAVETDCTEQDPEMCDFYPDYDAGGDGGGGATCDVGGRGASSCSVTRNGEGCSITCTGNYYACCKYGSSFGNPSSCRCVAFVP